MNALKKAGMILGAMGLALALSQASYAQTNSNIATVNLNATLAQSITVAAAPALVTFALAPNGPAAGSAPVTINTSWALAKAPVTLKLYAYFSSGNALTDGSGDNIPTSSVTGSVNGGAAAAFTSATPFGANGMTVFSQAIGVGTYNSLRAPADTIALTINTTGLNLPAATYNGVLNIEAQAL